MIMYKYALNKDGNMVSIDDISSNDEKKEFICPECKGILNPRALSINSSVTKHFYHLNKDGEGSAGQCSGESYLHWISKELLAECLRESDSFIAKYVTKESCKNKEADSICMKSVTMEIDIAKEYPHVYVEKKDEVYIPDIMLKNDKGEKIYIEIYKSSDSSDKKRNSGKKIIQIKVEHEKDIERILKKKVIEENSKSVEFINFKPGNFDCGGDCDYVDQKDYNSFEDSYRYSPIKRTPASEEERMKNFCLMMRTQYTYDDKRSNEFSVVYKGSNLWYVSCCNEFFLVSHFEMYHIVYDVVNGEIVHLAKELTFSGLDYAIKQYIVFDKK